MYATNERNSTSTRKPESNKSIEDNKFQITMDPRNFVQITTLFTFGDCLGQGSFAKVYSGEHRQTKNRVAIKVIDK